MHVDIQFFFIWKWLYTGTVPAYNKHTAGKVPSNKEYAAGKVPANKNYNAVTVPANKKYAADNPLTRHKENSLILE